VTKKRELRRRLRLLEAQLVEVLRDDRAFGIVELTTDGGPMLSFPVQPDSCGRARVDVRRAGYRIVKADE
jgi:hypothetical protein